VLRDANKNYKGTNLALFPIHIYMKRSNIFQFIYNSISNIPDCVALAPAKEHRRDSKERDAILD